MELTDAIARRRMTRHFSDRPVTAELLDRVLGAALRAPSAGFSQGLDLLVLESAERRARFWEVASEDSWRNSTAGAGLRRAPVIIVPVADQDAYLARYEEQDKSSSSLFGKDAAAWPVPYWLVDAAFASMLMLVQATDLGLGALFFQLHASTDSVLEGLGVPAGRELIGALALGYPAEDDPRTSTSRRARRSIEEVVHRERW